jgi:hypothetical protein
MHLGNKYMPLECTKVTQNKSCIILKIVREKSTIENLSSQAVNQSVQFNQKTIFLSFPSALLSFVCLLVRSKSIFKPKETKPMDDPTDQPTADQQSIKSYMTYAQNNRTIITRKTFVQSCSSTDLPFLE